MKNFLLIGASAGIAFYAVGVFAESAPVVVELYTSQGCPSCPPADEFLTSLRQDPSIIPLSIHVDYWDYIGWEDTFAQKQFTQRQYSYAQSLGDGRVYTPQMIVAGKERFAGTARDSVIEGIKTYQAQETPVKLDATRNGQVVKINARAIKPLTRPVHVYVVRYVPEKAVEITKGENVGMSVTYHNVVTSWQSVAEWDGVSSLDLSVDVSGDDPVVVILQYDGPSGIVAAAHLK